MHKLDDVLQKMVKEALCLFLLIVHARLVDEAAKMLTRMPKPAN